MNSSNNFNLPSGIDPTITSYLKAGPKALKNKNLNLEGNPAEFLVKDIAEKTVAKKDLNNDERSKFIEKKATYFGLKNKIIKTSWSTIQVTKKEADSFQKALGVNKNNPGKIGKYLYEGGIASNRNFFEDMPLDNGNILYGGEREGIYIYTSNNYLLLNGTLSNDATSLNEWEKCNEEHLPKGFLKEAQKHVPEMAKMAASGINKLPPYKGLIYRGDAMTMEQLAEWRDGKIMMTNKFFSCSKSVNTAEDYARNSAISYMQDTKVEYKPVLYIFNSETSKDIKLHSLNKTEDERIYNPGQAFQSVKVDEESVPGLAIIFLKEMKVF